MQDLITIVENEPRVSHRVVAEQTDNQQKNINELIRKYHDDIEEFGTLPFKTEAVSETKLKVNPDAKPIKTYYLNEPQATFLMTLLRNKPLVVEFKKKLVKEFYSQREMLKAPNQENELLHVVLKLVENSQRQTDMMFEMMGEMKNKQVILPASYAPDKISNSQKYNIRSLMNERCAELSDENGIDKKSILPGMWVALKERFDVMDYSDITQTQYKEFSKWLREYDISIEVKNPNLVII